MASQGGEGSSDSKMDHGEWKIFNDSVHGNMEFHPLCVAIVDTPEFQRLRYLKQLGVCYFVYPGASHNRFEHCLGVCYLAGLLVKRLQTTQPELDITEEDVLCVMIAGLCRDLGHGPFSHLFDKKFIPKSENWTHEQASKDLFDRMVKDEKLKECFEYYNIGDDRREFIKELICGKPEVGETKFYKPKTKKAFLYEIVANKRNEVDVDKMDYFKRDALHLGMTSAFDHMRFINFAKVIEVDGEWQICIRDKEVFNMYEMFHTRYALHRRAYQHKTVQAVEIMLLEAMKEANEFVCSVVSKLSQSLCFVVEKIFNNYSPSFVCWNDAYSAFLYKLLKFLNCTLGFSADISFLQWLRRKRFYSCGDASRTLSRPERGHFVFVFL